MNLNLKGRTVLITGGSRGIGESIAHVMAQEGCRITIAATDAEKLKQVADDITAKHGVPVKPSNPSGYQPC